MNRHPLIDPAQVPTILSHYKVVAVALCAERGLVADAPIIDPSHTNWLNWQEAALELYEAVTCRNIIKRYHL